MIPPARRFPELSTRKSTVPPSALLYSMKSPDGATSVARRPERIVVPFDDWTMSTVAKGALVPTPSLPFWAIVTPVDPATVRPPAKVDVAFAFVATKREAVDAPVTVVVPKVACVASRFEAKRFVEVALARVALSDVRFAANAFVLLEFVVDELTVFEFTNDMLSAVSVATTRFDAVVVPARVVDDIDEFWKIELLIVELPMLVVVIELRRMVMRSKLDREPSSTAFRALTLARAVSS